MRLEASGSAGWLGAGAVGALSPATLGASGSAGLAFLRRVAGANGGTGDTGGAGFTARSDQLRFPIPLVHQPQRAPDFLTRRTFCPGS